MNSSPSPTIHRPIRLSVSHAKGTISVGMGIHELTVSFYSIRFISIRTLSECATYGHWEQFRRDGRLQEVRPSFGQYLPFVDFP